MTIITDQHIIIASKILADIVEQLIKSHHSDWSRLMNELDMAHADYEVLFNNKGKDWRISDLYNGDRITELMEAYNL